MTTSNPPQSQQNPDRSEELTRQRRRKRILTYTSIGGGALGLAYVVYYWLFAAALLGVLPPLEEAIEALKRDNPSVNLRRDDHTGLVAGINNLAVSMSAAESADPARVAQVAVDIVETPAVAAAIGVPQTARLVPTVTYDDPVTHNKVVRLQQFIDHVRLFGGEIAISVGSGPGAASTTLAVRPSPLPSIDMQATVDETSARTAAVAHYATLAKDPRSRLVPNAEPGGLERVIFDPGRFGRAGEARLAWRLRLASIEMFVDAKTADIIAAYDTRHTARNRQTHDCGLGTACQLVLKETDAGVTPPHAQEVVRAHTAAETVHRYFQQTFQRDGFDHMPPTHGTKDIISFVRIPNLANAQWHPDLLRFEYGSGWMTLDMAAHEYTHAVTQFGPKLEYLGQPGAVNEFFSDFFAAMVERFAAGSTDWRIGEAVQGFSVQQPLRDMKNPNNGGFNPKLDFHPQTNAGQPDHLTKLVTEADQICSSLLLADNGCVHFNSGILNRAMALAIDGHQFGGQQVPPISREHVEQIMFRTLMFGHVTTASSLRDTAAGAINACQELRDASFRGITSPTCAALSLAFEAVGFPRRGI